MLKHPMSWLVKLIFWINPLSPLYAWLKLQLWGGLLKFLYQPGRSFQLHCQLGVSLNWSIYQHFPPLFPLWQISLHSSGSSWQNQILQRDWQSYCYTHGGWCKWLALTQQDMHASNIFYELSLFLFFSCLVMLPIRQGTVKTWLQVLMSFWMKWLSFLQENGTPRSVLNHPKRSHLQKRGMCF